LFQDLAKIEGLGGVDLVGETTLSELKTRPDFAVTVNNAVQPANSLAPTPADN